jgi:hypothetical protein
VTVVADPPLLFGKVACGSVSQMCVYIRAQEFQKCGDMVQFGTFGAVSRCNWIYIQYQARSK